MHDVNQRRDANIPRILNWLFTVELLDALILTGLFEIWNTRMFCVAHESVITRYLQTIMYICVKWIDKFVAILGLLQFIYRVGWNPILIKLILIQEHQLILAYNVYQVEEDGSVAKIRHGETFEDHLRYFAGL